MTITIALLAEKIGGEVQGDASVSVDSIANLSKAKPHQLSFLSSSKYANDLEVTQAGAVILSVKDAENF
ncbi:MAG: LpxD N-terminal domain-containing protein, partial [Pseudomonadota bacterium]